MPTKKPSRALKNRLTEMAQEEEKPSTSNYDNDAPSSSVQKKRTRRINDILKDNRKITDYFSVASKGRENIPKSSHYGQTRPVIYLPGTDFNHSISSLSTLTPPNKYKMSHYSPTALGKNIDLITLSDSEHDSSIPMYPTQQNASHNRVSRDSDMPTLSNNLQQPDNSLKTTSILYSTDETTRDETEDDIEILDMLPPIPLRDHPIHDVEE